MPAPHSYRGTVAIVVAHFDLALDYFETTAASFLANNWNVHVVTSTLRASTLQDAGIRQPDFASGSENLPNVTIHRLAPTFAQGQRVFARGVTRRLREIEPDLVIQVTPSQFFSLLASRYARKAAVPLIYVSGENSQQGPQRGWRKALKDVYWSTVVRAVIRQATRRASSVIVTTPETGRIVRRANPKCEPSLVPLPYRSDRFFLDQELRAAARFPWVGEDGHVTGFIGRFDPRKNLPLLIDGWELFARDAPNAHLLLVGIGTDAFSQALRKRVAASVRAESIHLRSFASATQVNAVLNAADVTIWPTVSVGIQQAAATGCYLLLPSASPGTFLIQGKAASLGATYDSADPSSLAHALQASRHEGTPQSRVARSDLAAGLYADISILERITGGYRQRLDLRDRSGGS